jgi:hypothetical protein
MAQSLDQQQVVLEAHQLQRFIATAPPTTSKISEEDRKLVHCLANLQPDQGDPYDYSIDWVDSEGRRGGCRRWYRGIIHRTHYYYIPTTFLLSRPSYSLRTLNLSHQLACRLQREAL